MVEVLFLAILSLYGRGLVIWAFVCNFCYHAHLEQWQDDHFACWTCQVVTTTVQLADLHIFAQYRNSIAGDF